MKILAVECSEAPASCAVWEDGRVVCESFVRVGLTHSRTLMPMLQDMLKNAEVSLSEVDRLAVSVGPGSFTGLRIGIAAVKGLSLGADLPCVGVSTLEAAAYGSLPLKGLICPVMDARCHQVYNALFESDGETLSRVCEDRALTTDELAQELAARRNARPDQPIWLTGNGVEVCMTAFGERMALAAAPSYWQSQRASCVAALAAGRDAVPAGALLPCYLRLPQAERELKRRREASASDDVQ